MSTFIHIADSHLGRSAFNKLADDGSNLRETLIYENFLAGIEAIIKAKRDVVVHAGDLFDTVKPKTKAYTTALDGLLRLHDAGIPVVMIAGNHSMQKNAYTTSAFEVLTRASTELHVAYSFKYECVEIGDTLFHLIPNMLHAADYAKAAAEIRIGKDHNNVLVTHGLASTIQDKRLSTVAEFELTSEILPETMDYIALGHYHGQMQISPNAWYSGSQEYLTYGEIRDAKGALAVDLDTHSVSHFPLPHSPMTNLGMINCVDIPTEEIADLIGDKIGSFTGIKDRMYQIVLDYADHPVRLPRMDTLAKIRESVLDIKIQVRSLETERQTVAQQDLHAIDYVQEFGNFMMKQTMSDAQREAVTRCGQDTLKAAIAENVEVGE
jgi:DNA repair exonuclease SbcCD nuclease subunit